MITRDLTCCSVAKSFLSVWNPMDWSKPRLPISHYFPEFAHVHVHWNQWFYPAISFSVFPFSSFPQSFPTFEFFSTELAFHIRWLKYWSFSFSTNHSNEYSGLIYFRIDWFDLLAVQGTLKSLLSTTIQKHQLSGTQLSLWFMYVLTHIHDYWHSAFFMVHVCSYTHTWLLEKLQALHKTIILLLLLSH